MRPLLLAAFLATVLLPPGTASAAGGWKRVTIERQQGAIHASLSFEARGRYGLAEYRRVALVVRRAGAVVVDDRRSRAPTSGSVTGLRMRNVWGDRAPEALVTIWTGGNACCTQIRVALVRAGAGGRVAVREFPFNWRVDRHHGRYDFVTSDHRFRCAFTACAGSSKPVQVFTIDRSGKRFVDVTRSRRDLVAASAARHWKAYVDGRAPDPYYGASGSYGVLAPWCAEQHLLGRKQRCDRVLAQELARGNLGSADRARALVRALRSALARWGYR